MSALAHAFAGSAAVAADACVNGYGEAGDGSTAGRVINVGEIQGVASLPDAASLFFLVSLPDAG